MTFDPNTRPAPDQPSYAALLRQLQEVQNENKQLKRTKKFGLVWEDKPDAQVERVFLEAPLLCEDREKAVVADEDAVNHVLINGDNFHALTALRATHTGKVDVIYIDPPYNTGNKDFIYNDDYVDAEDGYRHSKWLSFMDKRLRLARELLSDTGVIFVSIGDDEMARLRLLMDEVYGRENFVTTLVWKKKQGGSNNAKKVALEHEYVHIYVRHSSYLSQEWSEPYGELYAKRYKEEDDQGKFFWDTLQRNTGTGKQYPIVCPDGTTIEHKENGEKIRWLWSKPTFDKKLEQGEVGFRKKDNGWSVQFKQRMPDGKRARSILSDKGTTADGSALLSEVLGSKRFDNPKPSSLVSYLIGMNRNQDSIVLDFFAGSGTTAHAVAELNKADGGRRQCVLVTDGGKTESAGHSGSNANDNAVHIAEEITYERVRRVLTGQDWADGKEHEPLGGNLRYFNVHMEDIQSYSERDEAAAFAPFTRSHASIATSTFTVVEEKQADTVYGLPIDYTILSSPVGGGEVKYVVAVQAHDYELAELGEWFAALPEDTDVTIMGHWLEEVEWIKENTARIKLVDVMEQVSASRKHAKSLVYT